MVEVDESKVEKEVIPSSKINIFIASFTTSWARLELYSYLEKLQELVLYFDTDSIIYLWCEGLPEVETGLILGELKDETEDVPIKEFITGGPKNYSYKTQEGKTECKIRSFTVDEQGSALLNFHSMKNNILAEIYDPKEERRIIDAPVSVNFERNRTTKKIRLEPKVKKYGLVFDKRVIKTEDCTSRPYGYEWV